MWVLENSNNHGQVYHLLCGMTLDVARQGTAHILLPDRSISKQHASFYLTHESKYLGLTEKLPQVILSDLKSTNGTFVNGNKITPQIPVTVKHEDVICFGQKDAWRLLYHPLVVSCSQILKDVKNTLKEHIQCLGGHLVKDWTDNCHFLVMTHLVLTAKTVCALAAGAYIITPKYLADTIEAIKNKQTQPSPKDYLPPLKEPSLNCNEVSLFPDKSRRKLLLGKTFLFQSANSYANMKSVLNIAGASHDLLSTDNYHKVCLENHILVKKPDKDKNNLEEGKGQAITEALKLLSENRLNSIPESDIGLAIVYNSIEKYCNPSFRVNGLLQSKASHSQLSRELQIYATETQREDTPKSVSTPPFSTTILESGQSAEGGKTCSVARSKRPTSVAKLCASDDSERATELYVAPEEATLETKRKRSETGDPNLPSKRPHLSKEEAPLTLDEVDESRLSEQLDLRTQLGEDSSKTSADGARHGQQAPATGMVVTASSPENALRPTVGLGARSRSPTSIPFEPFTLPSLSMDGCAGEASPPVRVKKEQPASPTPMAEEGRWRVKEEVPATTPVEKEFALPMVSSLRRRRKAPRPSETIGHCRELGGAGDVAPCGGVAETSPPQKCPRLEGGTRLAVVETLESAASVLKGPEASPNDDKGPLIPYIQTSVKEENNDVSGLSDVLSKSLVIVQVVSLVRTSQLLVPAITVERRSQNGLPNFKRFRKVFPKSGISGLPRIIGGRDLVHHTTVNSHKDSFVASQPDLSAHFEERERERAMRDQMDKFDADFNLVAIAPRKRRRGRI